MNSQQIDIWDMQCHVFRMAQRKWNMTSSECTAIFQKYNLFGFISDCYDTLHLASYTCALQDIEEILESNGVRV